jgi:hypothetical protein
MSRLATVLPGDATEVDPFNLFGKYLGLKQILDFPVLSDPQQALMSTHYIEFSFSVRSKRRNVGVPAE